MTGLTFYQNQFMFCSNEDGTITVFECKDWEPIKTLKASKGSRINDFAVHPSGKFGISLSKNKTILLWDLIKGKTINVPAGGAATSTTAKSLTEPLHLQFSQDGSRYVILYADSSMDIFDLSSGGSLLKTIKPPSATKIHTVTFWTDDVLLFAGEDKIIYAYDTTSETFIQHPSEHKLRYQNLFYGMYFYLIYNFIEFAKC